MRKNTRIILLLLFCFVRSSKSGVSFSFLYLFLAPLSEGGIRSMILLLRRDGYVMVKKDSSQSNVYLTKQGRQLIEREIIKNGDGSPFVIIMGNREDAKKQKLLQKHEAIKLRQGVWLMTQEQLKNSDIKKMLNHNFNYFSLEEKIASSFFSYFLHEKMKLDTAIKKWVEISSKIDSLIEKRKRKNSPSKRDYSQLFEVFSLIDDRFQDKYYQFEYQRRGQLSSVSLVADKLHILASSF